MKTRRSCRFLPLFLLAVLAATPALAQGAAPAAAASELLAKLKALPNVVDVKEARLDARRWPGQKVNRLEAAAAK